MHRGEILTPMTPLTPAIRREVAAQWREIGITRPPRRDKGIPRGRRAGWRWRIIVKICRLILELR